jgi:hypothetical protein
LQIISNAIIVKEQIIELEFRVVTFVVVADIGVWVFFGVRLNWYSEIISTFTRYQGTKRYQASLVMFVDIWDFFPRFYFPLSSLFSASETFFPRGSCAHAKKMRRYKRKRKEILEVWDFSARLRKLKIIFQVYHQQISFTRNF